MLVAVTSCFAAAPAFATVGRLYLSAATVDFFPVEQPQPPSPSVSSVGSILVEQLQRQSPFVS